MAREVPQYVQQLSLGSAPVAQLSNAQARATMGVSEQLSEISQDIERRSTEIESLKATTELKTTLNDQFTRAPNDPAALKAMQDGYKEGFIKKINNPELAQKFSIIYDGEASALLARATEGFQNIQEQEHELLMLKAIDSSIETGARYTENIFSNVPEYVLGAETAMGTNAIAFDSLLSARKSNGEYMFSPAQQVSFKRRLEDGIMARAKEDMKLRMEDPAGWAEQRGLGVKQIVAMQEGSLNPTVIGKKTAKAYVQQLNSAGSAEELVMAAGQLLNGRYMEHKREALLDLRAAGLSPEQEAIINIYNSRNPDIEAANAIFETATLTDESRNAEYRLRTGGDNPQDLSISVAQEMEKDLTAMYNEGYTPNEAHEFATMTANLAKQYRIKNPKLSQSQAAEKAINYYRGQYNFAEINGVEFRVPVDYDAEAIADRLKAKLPEIEMADLENPELMEKSRRKLQDVAIPRLSSDGKGVSFVAPNGEVIVDKNRQPVKITFDEIVSGETMAERRKRVISEIEKLPYGEREAARKKAFGL
jgi:hypothetical protein